MNDGTQLVSECSMATSVERYVVPFEMACWCGTSAAQVMNLNIARPKIQEHHGSPTPRPLPPELFQSISEAAHRNFCSKAESCPSLTSLLLEGVRADLALGDWMARTACSLNRRHSCGKEVRPRKGSLN